MNSTNLASGISAITSGTAHRPGSGGRGIFVNINTSIAYFKLQLVFYNDQPHAYFRIMSNDEMTWGAWVQLI